MGRMRLGWRGRSLVAGLAWAGCSHPTQAQPRPAPIDGFERCASPRGGAWCGTVTVPEDHDDPGSRRIGLRVKILEATAGTPAPDPVFFLAGGPGQAVADLEALIVSRFGARLPDRDFVLVDQRGTGGSNPLTCPTGAPGDPSRLFGPHYTEDEITACLARLETRADVRQYTTSAFARDLDQVREALGAPVLDLVGGSYGTKAAQVYMRAFPDRVRAAVLEGVASTSFLNPLPAARGSQDALDALFRDCAADAACGARFPDLAVRFAALMERLATDPPQVPVPGSSVTVPLEPEALAYVVHILLFNTQSAALLPALVDQVERGEYPVLTAVYRQVVDGLVQGIFIGLQLAVTCTENEPFFDTRDLEAETRGTYLGRLMVDGVREQCAVWPRGTVPADFLAPVTVDVPTLLVSGGLDPATPRRFADEVAASLPRSVHVTVDRGAHVTVHPCIDQLVADFVATAGAVPPATGCLAAIVRPPFQVPGG